MNISTKKQSKPSKTSKKMEKNSIKDYSNVTNFDQLLDDEYGELGTPERTEFQRQAQMWIIAEMVKEERKKAKLSQEQLAKKIGTQKSYISRIERASSDIQLSTLFKIFEDGMGLKLNFTVSHT